MTKLETSDDAFLGGLLSILQPVRAYRAGMDAVLLAAAAPVRNGCAERVLDAGAGAGVVGLCVARRVSDASVTLLEVDPQMAELARRNIDRNNLAGRVNVVVMDVTKGGGPLHAGSEDRKVTAAGFDHVLANPPYQLEGAGRRPADGLKAKAHLMASDDLDRWMRFLSTAADADGVLTLIHRADALGRLIHALEGRFGDLHIFPVYSRENEPALRVIVRGTKGSRAPLKLLRGVVLHGEGNAFRPEVEAIFRQGAQLEVR